MVHPLPAFGEGYRIHVTGLTHDKTGFPTNNNKVSGELVERICNKVEMNVDDFSYYEEYRLADIWVELYNVPSSIREKVLRIPNVKDATGRIVDWKTICFFRGSNVFS